MSAEWPEGEWTGPVWETRRMSTEPHTIPNWAMQAARQVYTYAPIGALVPHIAKAIHDAVMAERERCARIADDEAAGRDWQRADANAHNDKRAARDFETMKIEAVHIASAIRATSRAEGK